MISILFNVYLIGFEIVLSISQINNSWYNSIIKYLNELDFTVNKILE